MNEDTASQFAVVDDALRTYPLDPPPPTLVPGVMARVHALTPKPRFQLTWFDYAMALFGMVMLGLGLALWQAIPMQAIADAVNQIDLTFPQFDVDVWIVLLTGETIIAALAIVFALVFFERMGTHRSFRTL